MTFSLKLEQSSLKHLKNMAKINWSNLNQCEYIPKKSSHIISNNLIVWNRYDRIYAWKADMKLLTIGELSILNQLRTEHISLNWCFHALQHYQYYKIQMEKYRLIKYYMKCDLKCCEKNNSGMCKHCGAKETVYHYLIECTKYDMLRYYLLHCVAEIFTIYDINLTLENILFPPKALSWYHRKMVLDNICRFVKDSRRLIILT